MIIFNFHTNDGIKDVQIDSPNYQYTFKQGDNINYDNADFIVDSIEYRISENSIEQIVSCEPHVYNQ